MKRSIGVKVFGMVIVLVVLFLINCFMNNAALRDIEKKNNNIASIYMEVVDLAGKTDAEFVNLKLEANLACLMDNPELVPQIAAGIPEKGDAMIARLDEIEGVLGQVEVGKDELMTAFAAYRENIELFVAVIPEISSLAGAGKQKEANAIIDSLYLSIMEEEELHAAFLEKLDYSIGKAKNQIKSKIEGTIVFNFIVLLVYIVATVIVALVVSKTIVKPAKNASGHLSEIMEKIRQGEGDLTQRIPVKSKDEVGQLVVGVNGFVEQLQVIMQKLQAESANMMESVEATMSNVSESNNSAENVSATMEQLAASMEEVAATLDEIARGSKELVNAIQNMSDEAEHGADLVDEIKKKAEEINYSTVESKRETDGMMNDIRRLLEEAVDESRSVSQINELTGDILDISSQTNLLALNASIEAARAGEAGKGFAVVADEIRVLAENSKNTANNIQEISQLVTNAVEKLSKNAEEMLAFIDSKVMKDYDSFVDIANQYRDDADSMNEILKGFAESTMDMQSTVRSMNEGINGITTTVDESARGVANAAENAGQLVDAISQIQEETRNNQDISALLSEEVKKFKNV